MPSAIAEHDSPRQRLDGQPILLRNIEQQVVKVDGSRSVNIDALVFSPDGTTLAAAADWRVNGARIVQRLAVEK